MLQKATASIRGLEAGFVAHRQWPLRKWYYANPLWFYHEPFAADEMIPSPKFYELMDPELRDLCRGLHAAGLHTTPSCQGHFYEKERFERIWAELERERAKIIAGGLEVKDSETQEAFLFQDEAFSLPWDSFDSFYAEASAQQGIGYLGVLVPFEREDLHAALLRLARRDESSQIEFDDAIGRRLGSHLLAIHVAPPTPLDRGELWRGITERVLAAVEVGGKS